jgi:hypothetical protein
MEGIARDGRRRVGLWAAGLPLCALGFYAVGLLYGGFPMPYGLGVHEIHPAELVYDLWLLVFATPAVVLAARALDASALPRRAIGAVERAARWRGVALAGALAAFAAALAIRRFVLVDAPIADDESTYAFIARTLLAGRLANPSPGDDAFFSNQFVVLDGASWYGKYPVGHPALLALGEAFGARALVVPAITAASFALTLAVGRLALPPGPAALGALLLLLSPQFLFTGATQLSQPASGLCLLVGLWALLRLDAGGGARFAAAAGAAFGAGVLVRPLPGVLFVAVAAVFVLLRFQREPASRQLARIAAGGAPLALAAGLLLAVHAAQTGDPTRSGYHAFAGGPKGWFRGEWIAASVAGAALRQNFWLFGWPLSFAFLPFAARHRRALLLWAMVGAVYAYRVALPKTVVAATGPIYVAEAVPLLALLGASGMTGAARRLAALGIGRARERVAAVALASVAAAAVFFLPVQVRELRRSGETWQTAHRLLDEAGAERALVFADAMVDVSAARSWAYYPPNPSPALDDPRIFVRIPQGDDAPARARDFWQRRFPDRPAWLFRWEDHQPVLLPLGGPVTGRPRDAAAAAPGAPRYAAGPPR